MMRELPTPDLLDQLEHEWPVDPKADALVSEMFDEHGLQAVSNVLQTLVHNDDVKALTPETCPLPKELLAAVHGYLDDVQTLDMPPWADPKRIESTVTMFMEHGLSSYLVLTCASLPECYIARDIAHVLAATQKLNKEGHRRLVETSQFVLRVMTPGGLTSADGEGLLVVHKVRLMHATVRHLIRERDQLENQLDRAHLGHGLATGSYSERSPINQVVLALTLQTFGYVILRGVKTLGVRFTAQEQDDFIHTWSVVGHFLGIRDELLPSDFEQARDIFELLKKRQRESTPEGKELTASLLKFTAQMLPWYLRRLPRKMVTDLMSEADCAALGVKQRGFFGRIVDKLPLLLARWHNRRYRILSRILPAALDVGEFLSRRLLNRISELPPSEQMRIYSLPDHLYEAPPKRARRKVAESA